MADRRQRWTLMGLALTGLAGVITLIIVAPRLLYPPLSPTELSQVSDPGRRIELDNNRRKLENDARTTLLQGVGGLAVLAGAFVGYRQLQLSRRQLDQSFATTQEQLQLSRQQLEHALTTSATQHKLDRQSQITERFTRAIEQLGNQHRQLDVILGGIYALERIARDSPDYRPTIAEILTAHIRGHAPWPPAPYEDWYGMQPSELPELVVRAPDIQAAITVLGRGGFSSDQAVLPLDLRLTDLRKADLHGLHLERAQLQDAHLEQARLQKAHLERAWLHGAHLEGASLWGAHLEQATLWDAQLKGAVVDSDTVWPERFSWKEAGVEEIPF